MPPSSLMNGALVPVRASPNPRIPLHSVTFLHSYILTYSNIYLSSAWRLRHSHVSKSCRGAFQRHFILARANSQHRPAPRFSPPHAGRKCAFHGQGHQARPANFRDTCHALPGRPRRSGGLYYAK